MDTANEVIWFDPWGDCRHIWPSVNKFAGGHLPAQSLALHKDLLRNGQSTQNEPLS